MSDLISRSSLLKRLNEYVFDAFDCDGIDGENVVEYQKMHDDNSSYIIQGFNDVYELLEDIPTVDAVPVVHAEWIDIQPDYHSGFYGNVHKCSNCNDYYTTEYYDLFFCPRCGAKMDGKKVQE